MLLLLLIMALLEDIHNLLAGARMSGQSSNTAFRVTTVDGKWVIVFGNLGDGTHLGSVFEWILRHCLQFLNRRILIL